MKPDELKKILDDATTKFGVPGATCGMWVNDEFVDAQSGVLNTETRHDVKSMSMFQIGSISKVLTATLVMKLVDQGKVSLDSPVRDYIPDLKLGDEEVAAAVTVRQLLNHTSGIAGDFMPDTGLGPDRLERYLDKYALLPQCHGLGDGFSYSNSALLLSFVNAASPFWNTFISCSTAAGPKLSKPNRYLRPKLLNSRADSPCSRVM